MLLCIANDLSRSCTYCQLVLKLLAISQRLPPNYEIPLIFALLLLLFRYSVGFRIFHSYRDFLTADRLFKEMTQNLACFPNFAFRLENHRKMIKIFGG